MLHSKIFNDLKLQIEEKIKARNTLKTKNDALYAEISKNIARRRELLREIEELKVQIKSLKHSNY